MENQNFSAKKPAGISVTELTDAEFRYGFYNGTYLGEPTDFILLEAPQKNPSGVWTAKTVPIAKGEIPTAIGEPVVIEMADF